MHFCSLWNFGWIFKSKIPFSEATLAFIQAWGPAKGRTLKVAQREAAFLMCDLAGVEPGTLSFKADTVSPGHCHTETINQAPCILSLVPYEPL